VEILCGVLSGAAVGANVGTIYDDKPGAANTGLFFVALNPDFFVGRVEFERRLREMAQEIHDIPLAKGVEQIYLPGERRRMTAKERSQTGIPVSSETVDDLTDLALRLGIPFPQQV
jgi:ureidoglycolate dehydrogenase (NAD+)